MRINLNSKYSFKSDSILSTADLKTAYLAGINLNAPNKRGEVLSEESISQQISFAQREVERILDIKLSLQKVSHSNSFYRDDWVAWGYIPVSYPVVYPCSLIGQLGAIAHINYPKDWISSKRSSDQRHTRKVYITPYSRNAQTYTSGLLNTPFHNTFNNSSNIPNYWNIEYITGYDIPPIDLISIVGKLAAINVLVFVGDLLLPIPGAASYSISLDGLSQNTSTVANAKTGIYGARISQLTEEITSQIPNLLEYYKGITFAVL